jgi:hypothetical protein
MKASIVMHLMANQSLKVMEQLIDDFIDESPLEDPIVGAPKKEDNCVAMQQALRNLLESKKDYDFEIILKGTAKGADVVVKCHRFVLQARWPFFALAVNSNMREATNQRYEMASSMHPKVLNVLLEVAYTGAISDSTRKAFDAATAMQLLAAEMYFKTRALASTTSGDDSNNVVEVDEPFGELIALAQKTVLAGISASN